MAAVIGAAMLAGAATAQQAPVVVGGAAAPDGAAPSLSDEQQRWDLVSRQGTAEAYRGYLAAYPAGPHAAEARAMLGQLQAGAPVGGTLPVTVVPSPAAAPAAPPAPAPAAPPAASPAAPELPPGTSPAQAAQAEAAGSGGGAAAESALGLSTDTRRRVQLRLNALGHDTRGADGVFGSGTRRAITAWQRERGYAATGYLDAAQLRLLQQDGASVPAPPPAAVPAGDAAAETALDLTMTQRRIIQSRLTQLGHDTKGVDGRFGAGTRAAISAWQRASGVPATGYLTRADADAILNAGTTPVVTPAAPAPADESGAAAGELALNLTREDRTAMQRKLVAAGYDTRGVDGQFGSGSRRAIRAWQTARGEPATGYLTRAQAAALRGASAGPADKAPQDKAPQDGAGASAVDEIRLNLSSVERVEVQTRLDALGYDTRGIDGAFGSGTRAAIRKWQGDNALPVTGFLNRDQLQQLRVRRRD
ncbi:peptidoglycan-binding domain-containing protein [Paracoccus contaminans]|nr:peptidoglycan-binding domain-containing protein [Paracoccus contaminans]